MIESLGFIQEILRHLDYFWITVLMTIESSFIPFPSEVVVPPAAYMVANNNGMSLLGVIFFATLGADLGALINFYLAKWLGRIMIYKLVNTALGKALLLSKEKVEQSEEYFKKNGAISTLVGRLLPGIRQLISIPAGLANMRLLPFLLYTTIGAGIWNTILAGLGYWLGHVVPEDQLIPTVTEYSRWIGLGIFLVVLAFIGYHFLKKRKPTH